MARRPKKKSPRREYQKEYYMRNKAKRQAYFKEYYKNNKEKIKAASNARYIELKEEKENMSAYDKYYEEQDKNNIHIALSNFQRCIQKLLDAIETENPDMHSILDDFIQNVTFKIEQGQPNVLKHYLKSFLHIYTGENFSTHIHDCVSWFLGFQNKYDLPFIYDVVSEKDLEKICVYLNSYGEIKRPLP